MQVQGDYGKWKFVAQIGLVYSSSPAGHGWDEVGYVWWNEATGEVKTQIEDIEMNHHLYEPRIHEKMASSKERAKKIADDYFQSFKRTEC